METKDRSLCKEDINRNYIWHVYTFACTKINFDWQSLNFAVFFSSVSLYIYAFKHWLAFLQANLAGGKRNILTSCIYISYPKINAICIRPVINDKCCEWVQFRQQTSKMEKRKMELSEREGNIQRFPSFRSKGSNNKK